MSKEMGKLIDDFKTFNDKKLNENVNEDLINLWNNYLKLVDIIDGIISEHGELSTRYWKDGLEEELDDITSNTKTTKDIFNNKQRIINNFNMLMDGIDGWLSEGKSISRYGSLSKINKSLFKKG